MKLLNYLFALVLLIGSFSLSYSQETDTENELSVNNSEKIEMYYFHFTRRCATCNAVESVSKEALNEFYGNEISFTSLNLEEEDGKNKGEELNISAQTLLIVHKEEQINITNEGFLHARSNPDKLKQVIKEKIDPLL